MMIGLSIYVGYHARTRWGTHWQKFGPTYITILASIFVMCDLSRHVLSDLNWWPSQMNNGWGSDEYTRDRAGCEQGEENMGCLSTVGVLFTIVFTYTGFLLLVVGTMWNANICDKLKDFRTQWRRIRAGDSS